MSIPIVRTVLFICSGNNSRVPVFIERQKDLLEQRGVAVEYFMIKGKGIYGYLKNCFSLNKLLRAKSFDLLHGHYGLSGLVACVQRKAPVVVSYYGSDINNKRVRIFSQVAHLLADRSIAVSQMLGDHLPGRNTTTIIPCSVDTDFFYPLSKELARKELEGRQGVNFWPGKRYLLFSSRFDRPVKNAELAFKVIKLLGSGFELIEIKGYTDREVMLLMNACDALILTSHSEGSPQVIKEAMACNRPIVTVNVGDVAKVIGETPGCMVVNSFDPAQLADAVLAVINQEFTAGRTRIGNSFGTELVTNKILEVYAKAFKKSKQLKRQYEFGR